MREPLVGAHLASVARPFVVGVFSGQNPSDGRGDGQSKTDTEDEKNCRKKEADDYIHVASPYSCQAKAAAEPAAPPITMAVNTKGVSERVTSPEQPNHVATKVRSRWGMFFLSGHPV